jgi:ABC-type Zn uptake system ZnuABC Zn-binding protein ZnuA
MRHHVGIAFAVLLALAFALGACGTSLRILCTTTIVGDVVRAVAGPEALITALVPPGVDPHAFQPAPGDARAIEEADLVFQSGAGLEASFATILSAARGPVVDLSAGLALRGSEAGDDAHALVDPHVWFDPDHIAEWVRVIESALATADPAEAERFAERAAAYRAELQALDAWIRATTAELAPEDRRLVTDHEAFAYFAARYGFEQVGTVFPGTSTLSEPSARDLALLEDAIRASGARAIFVGTTVAAGLAEQVAADTGTRIVFLYTGSLSEPDGPAASYLDLMRYDVRAIVDALAGKGNA